MQFSPAFRNFPLGPNTLLSTLFSNTLSLCSYLSVTAQFSLPYKTTGKSVFHLFKYLIFQEGNGKTDSLQYGSNQSPNLIFPYFCHEGNIDMLLLFPGT